MSSVIQLVKLMIAAAVFIPILWMASCAAIGVGTVKAVEAAADSELAAKLAKAAEEHERREKNDYYYREADYSIQYDDYGDPM